MGTKSIYFELRSEEKYMLDRTRVPKSCKISNQMAKVLAERSFGLGAISSSKALKALAAF